MKRNEENGKVQIDYLKKIRLKNRIKSVLFVLLVFGAIFVGWYLYKFWIINGVCQKVEKQFEGENFYIETISSYSEDSVMVSKTWYKDGKYKVVMYHENEEQILQKFDTQYGNVTENAQESYFVNEEERKVRKEKLLFEKTKDEFINAQSVFLLKSSVFKDRYAYVMFKLGEPFYTKISTAHKEIGRKYYVFDSGETKKWVDMDTGLLIMSFGETLSTSYYKNTKIPKERFESITEYHYEFGKVIDEAVEMPNLEGYEIEELDWKEEVNKLIKEHEENS